MSTELFNLLVTGDPGNSSGIPLEEASHYFVDLRKFAHGVVSLRAVAPEVFERIAAEHPRGGVAVKVAEFATNVNTVTKKKKDFIGWARQPKSAIAFNAVLDLARSDNAFAQIVDDLRAAGHVVGDILKNRWDGQSWVKA